MPWWLVLIHVILAAALFAWTVGLVARLWRPVARKRRLDFANVRAERLVHAGASPAVLVAAFRGWNDGGQGATLAAGYLAKQWDAEQFAEIEPETFYDFQATRPQVSLEDGMTRKLEWPENTLLPCADPGRGPRRRDPARNRAEPPLEDLLRLVLGLAQDLGVERIVTFGSLLADVPHTRPAPSPRRRPTRR